MASIAPKTPTTPSYFPEYGMASMWEPVATAPSSGSEPSLYTGNQDRKFKRQFVKEIIYGKQTQY